MRLTTLCYAENGGRWLMMHRIRKAVDENAGKWIGLGGHLLEDETPEECIRREVREEAGRDVIPESIRAYGLVRRLEKGHREAVFQQDNHYFFCEAEDTVFPPELDDYEREDGFVPEVIAPDRAAAANQAFLAGAGPEKCRREAERELRVLELLIREGIFSGAAGGSSTGLPME